MQIDVSDIFTAKSQLFEAPEAMKVKTPSFREKRIKPLQ